MVIYLSLVSRRTFVGFGVGFLCGATIYGGSILSKNTQTYAKLMSQMEVMDKTKVVDPWRDFQYNALKNVSRNSVVVGTKAAAIIGVYSALELGLRWMTGRRFVTHAVLAGGCTGLLATRFLGNSPKNKMTFASMYIIGSLWGATMGTLQRVLRI